MKLKAFGTTMAYLVLASILAPVVMVVWASFIKGTRIGFPPPDGYSLEWYRKLGSSESLVSAALSSLQVAAVATGISLVLGLMAAVALQQVQSPRLKAGLDALLLAPLVVPWVVTGLGIYVTLFFAQQSLAITLVPSTFILVTAHVLVTLPWTYKFISTGMSPQTRLLERASLSLGVGRARTFWSVTLPLLRPHIVGGGVLAFIFSFANLEINLFLTAPGSEMLSVSLMQHAVWRVDPILAVMGTLQMLMVAILMMVAVRLIGYGSAVKR